jgi:hypothetical protein
VLWGAFNIAVGYLLVYQVGSFSTGRALDVAVVGIGGLLMALTLAWSFGRAGRR